MSSHLSLAIARSIYATAFRQNFPVSAKAMAWEIWLHAAPEALDRVINNHTCRKNCNCFGGECG
ncbi:hypothetical protein ACPA0F_20630 [Solibacillus silvestris]